MRTGRGEKRAKRIDRLTEKSRALVFRVLPCGARAAGEGGDVLFLGGVAAIAALGVLFVYSASCYTAKVQYGDAFYFLKKQLLGFFLGLAAMLLPLPCGRRAVEKGGRSGARCGRSPACGGVHPGAREDELRRHPLAGAGARHAAAFRACKVCLRALFGGAFRFDPSRPRRFSGILPVLGAGAALCVLILLEPNLSVTMVMGALMLGMLFLAGTPIKTLLLILLPILLAVPVLILAEPYRLRRLMAFLDPWSSPQDEGYQLIQSLYALANGDLFGVGLFSSRQKYRFLPFAESDFILSVIAEETGFFGVLCLFLLIGFVVWRGFRIAANARTFYEYLLVSGIMFAFAVQAALNALVVSGCVPPTGLPLPLVSAGNTSLIVTMAGMGVVFGVSRRQGGA